MSQRGFTLAIQQALGVVPDGKPGSQTYAALYDLLWDQIRVNRRDATRLDAITKKILEPRNRSRYEAVSEGLRSSVDWRVIAAIHNMESSLRFSRHLANGDPLKARTVNVPAGIPKKGKPPFTWEEAAIAAIQLKNWHLIKNPPNLETSPGYWCEKLERYNGTGYRRKGILTPYLFSGSGFYTKGKFVSDGRWSANAISKQIGAMLILKKLTFAS